MEEKIMPAIKKSTSSAASKPKASAAKAAPSQELSALESKVASLEAALAKLQGELAELAGECAKKPAPQAAPAAQADPRVDKMWKLLRRDPASRSLLG